MQTLLLNESITTIPKLRSSLIKSEEFLSKLPVDQPLKDFVTKYNLLFSYFWEHFVLCSIYFA